MDQTVRRRVNMLAAHLASHEDISATASHVFPMSCSNSLNTGIWRRDNRIYFARQGCGSQACYMRQASNEQENLTPHATPLKSTGYATNWSDSAEPMFSRPAQFEPTTSNVREILKASFSSQKNVREIQSVVEGCKYTERSPGAPKFARPNGRQQELQFNSSGRSGSFESEFKWSPRMDVIESGCNYIAMLELPGVNINSIRVEVNDQVLTVTGNRSIQTWEVDNCSNESNSCYHKREILQGPYQMMWSLPANVNKDAISAEFLDGLLRIKMPKLVDYRGLRKGRV